MIGKNVGEQQHKERRDGIVEKQHSEQLPRRAKRLTDFVRPKCPILRVHYKRALVFASGL